MKYAYHRFSPMHFSAKPITLAILYSFALFVFSFSCWKDATFFISSTKFGYSS